MSIFLQIANARSAREAFQLSRQYEEYKRKDWEQVKEDIMFRALEAKFTTHPILCHQLLATSQAHIVEHTHADSYWGDGGNGKGRNRLGYLLEQLRDTLIGKHITQIIHDNEIHH
jgi:ribA/ribD-fused uncharacterized protein